MQTDEIWKQIPQYPKYEVSDAGAVRLIESQKTIIAYAEHLTSNKELVMRVMLKKVKGTQEHRSVKSCVVMAFLPEKYCAEYTHITNIDGNFRNNALSNLLVDSRVSGSQRRCRDGRRKDLKLNPAKVRAIRRMIQQGNRVTVIAARFGVCRESIYQINWGKRWSHVV